MKKIRPLDFILAGVFILAIALSFSFAFQKNNGRNYLTVSNGESTFVYPMENDITFSVPGKNGATVIGIEKGYAFFIDSQCPNKTCITSGKISLPGEWISCLPNGVFAKIECKNSRLDAVTN